MQCFSVNFYLSNQKASHHLGKKQKSGSHSYLKLQNAGGWISAKLCLTDGMKLQHLTTRTTNHNISFLHLFSLHSVRLLWQKSQFSDNHGVFQMYQPLHTREGAGLGWTWTELTSVRGSLAEVQTPCVSPRQAWGRRILITLAALPILN